MDKVELIKNICLLPQTFNSGNISYFDLLNHLSSFKDFKSITEEDLQKFLKNHSNVIKLWQGYSEDQRSSPAYHLMPMSVGYSGASEDKTFNEESAACAFFITKTLELDI